MRGATLRVGERTGLGPGCRCMASVTIGDDCLISADVRFVGDDHPIHVAGRLNEAPSRFPREVVVGDDVLIGAGAIVIGPANVGTGAVIAAGAVVTGDVAPRSIVGGVPARVIGERRNP
ncbi:acyltransferase [Nocardioides seonyuensis]|nr:acyltransferase [Nocardioides seonyuensis]